MIANADALMKPLRIKDMVIRNRVMSTSHAPGYGSEGKPKERYQLYHAEKARGGIGLTMFGGSSSVARDSPATPWNQISVADDSVVPFFREFSDRVHGHGAKLMIQLTHMGRRTRWDIDNWLCQVGGSWCLWGRDGAKLTLRPWPRHKRDRASCERRDRERHGVGRR